jgi:dTDP-4-amino-4,6-dideoxygalactose transaminase
MNQSNDFIPLARASITEAELDAVREAMLSGWLTRGPQVGEFEEAFATYVGVDEAIATNSCTSALHLAVLGAGVGAGDEVIVPTITFAATANVVVHAGAKPVFADVRRDTLNIDPGSVHDHITPNTKAIIAVHYAGQPCDMDALEALADEHGLEIIEDAAHAVGAEHHGRRIGSLGHTTCFSFYPIKNMTTGEGGMLTGASSEVMARLRTMTQHGLNAAAWARYGQKGSWRYEVTEAGFKYNMTDPEAALGKVQLLRLPSFIKRRSEIAALYSERLGKLRRVRFPETISGVTHAWHLFPIIVDFEGLVIDRDDLIERLRERGIGTSVHFIPLHTQPYYRDNFNCKKGDCPEAEEVFEGLLSIPMFPDLTNEEAERVCEALEEELAE